MHTAIYIHLPYCLTKCPYCDFNSYGVGMDFPERLYTDSVLKEMDIYSHLLKERDIRSVFFGGGTPSLFTPGSIGRMLDRLSDLSVVSDDTEITLEVNPRTADEKKLREFGMAGINRISVGIQSFIQKKLDYFKRFCTPQDCNEIINDIKNAGFENFNIDLMYGAYGESVEDLCHDLKTAVGSGNNHLSVYCLTIEENTEFGKMHRDGELYIPDDELLAQMYGMTSEYLEKNGFRQYETSNFAREGFECAHNLTYWRSEDYIGFGAGAHSHMRKSENVLWGERWSNNRSPKHYIGSLSEGNKPVDYHEVLDRESSVQDALVMGLRLKEGIDISVFDNRYGIELKPERYHHLIEDGFVNIDGNRLYLTHKGFLYSNRLILDIISGIDL